MSAKRLKDVMDFSSNRISILLDREPRPTDPQVFMDPKRNPRLIAMGERELTVSTEMSDAEYARELYEPLSSAQLYDFLNGPFLLVVDGQLIQQILIARGEWSEYAIGIGAEFVPCRCSVCIAEAKASVPTIAQSDVGTVNTHIRSAA